MSLQIRFVLLTAAGAAVLLLGLSWQNRADRREATQIREALRQERGILIDHLLETTGGRLQVFADDYSAWDEMVAYVAQPNEAWAQTNVDPALESQKLDALWVFRPDRTEIHGATRGGMEALRRFPLGSAALAAIATGLNKSHCFVATDAGLLEMRGAPIRPSDQTIVVPAASGWLFAGQLWNDAYLAQLALLTGGKVELAAPGASAAAASTDDLAIVDTRALKDWSGRPVREISFRYTPVMLERTQRHDRHRWWFFAVFGIVALAGYYLAVRRWIVRPLRQLGASLARHEAAPLARVREAGKEFAALARIVGDSFVHEHTLRQVCAAFNAIDEAVFIVDASGAIVDVNDGAVRLLGFTREELAGRTLDSLRIPSPADPAPTSSQLYRFRHRDGRTVELEVGQQKAAEGAGALLRVVVAHDVSERQRQEQQRLRAQRMESLGTLAGGIAHDLNNMLTPISLMLDDLHVFRQLPTPDLVAGVRSSVQRSAAMLRQLLAFGRGMTGERRPLAVPALIEETIRIAQCTFPKSIRFEITTPPNLWSISGDPTQLHQVLLNLCVNARDAMPAGGLVKLQAANLTIGPQGDRDWPEASPGRYVLIEVTDTGCGIAAQDLERIFEPFFTTKEPDKGTGLGLSTTLAIIRSHRGSIRAVSESRRGATFRVVLPAREAAVASAATPATVAFHGQGRTVLVVEDDPSIRSFITTLLERFSMQVFAADNGADGLRLFQIHRGKIDVIISDLQMPVMDGSAMAHSIRELEPAIPVIFMSGRIADGAASSIAHLGNAFVINKPFAAMELAGVLRLVLG